MVVVVAEWAGSEELSKLSPISGERRTRNS